MLARKVDPETGKRRPRHDPLAAEQLDLSQLVAAATGLPPSQLFQQVRWAVASGDIELCPMLCKAQYSRDPDLALARLVLDEIYPNHLPLRAVMELTPEQRAVRIVRHRGQPRAVPLAEILASAIGEGMA